MKFIAYKSDKMLCAGIKTDKGIVDIQKTAALQNITAPANIEEIIKSGAESITLLNNMLKNDLIFISEDDLVYAPVIQDPEKVLCVGLNYKSHVEEAFENMPKEPILFSKFNNALSAHKQTITLPKTAKNFDYEAELVIIIGKEASNVSIEDALSYVFGYTTGNDFSARDLQFISGQWLLGKTCDGFGPTGPIITTADEIEPQNLEIKCIVNGEVRQSSNTNLMMFSCAKIVSYASKYMTLKPGDLIFTGTPNGVILGYPEDKRIWLKAGDHVAVEIEGIGKLENTLK